MNTATIDMDEAVESFARTSPVSSMPRLLVLPAPWTTDPQEPQFSESSTAAHDRPREISEELSSLFAAAKEQVFEDGTESEFSRGLVSLVKAYGNDTLAELAYFIVYEKANAEVVSEALRWLGLMNHPSSYGWRLWLLERSLGSSSARIRDGAALGLAFLNDPAAIPYLNQAVERESIAELRQDMQQVLAQLESSDRCRSS